MRLKFVFVILLLGLWQLTMATTRITHIQLKPLTHATRIEIDTSAPASFHQFGLVKPYRLVLDFDNATVTAAVIKKFKAAGPIKSLRYSPHKKMLRLVFDLTGNWSVNTFRMPRSKAARYRIAADVHGKTSKPIATKKTKYQLKPVLTMPQLTVAEPQVRDIMVMIDPGHGGKDPGATGVNGHHEKDVVLAIAKKLQRYINQQKGFHAELTRKGNYYITLRDRLNIARKNKSDVFVSIHADAYNNKTANGASVFALSQRGATSEAARWLAERENRSELMGGVSLADKGNILRSVLIDLSQTATIGSSIQLGQQLLQNLSRVTRLHHQSVEQAAFVVLKSPDIPSLLVETGFMSSKREAKLLTTSKYQSKIAYAIMIGLKQYFVQHPPRGTMLAALQKNDFRYYVKPGDTLGKIAKHFRVSIRKIVDTNSLNLNATLHVGQLLLVPKHG